MDNSMAVQRYSDDDWTIACVSVDKIKILRSRLYKKYAGPAEFMEPSLAIETRPTVLRQVKYLNQTAFMQCLILKHEYGLKLLLAVDGYLLVVASENSSLTYLSARHIFELQATLHYIGSELDKARSLPIRDWRARAQSFLSVLWRSRYAASDPRIAKLYKDAGASTSAMKPFNITEAIKGLTSVSEFKNASCDYDFLSNMCHHNGSGHRLFVHSQRNTDRVVLQTGEIVVSPDSGSAVTLVYPPVTGSREAIIMTATHVHSCMSWSSKWIEDLPMLPLDDQEVAEITKGECQSSLNRRVVGRNDLCVCGSGKKFKRCCIEAYA
jgi:hypothetical protein